MANSTAPILAAGGITLCDKLIKGTGTTPLGAAEFLKVGVATGIAAIGLAAFEHVSEPIAVGVAWIVVITVVLTSSVVNDLVNITGEGSKK
jgi:hypothetical protein